jgi:hypothetical protein
MASPPSIVARQLPLSMIFFSSHVPTLGSKYYTTAGLEAAAHGDGNDEPCNDVDRLAVEPIDQN